MPDNFVSSNNLAKKSGSFYRAFGEIIFIQGTITDSFGLPITSAVVEIWQANSAGKYHTLLEEDSEYIDKYFKNIDIICLQENKLNNILVKQKLFNNLNINVSDIHIEYESIYTSSI